MIKTLAQILAGLPDNVLRLIQPVNARDIAEGSFGALLARDPTANDDSSNTSGAGFFSSRSWWQNSATGSVFRCHDGATGAAVWLLVYPQSGTPFLVTPGDNITVVEAPAGTFEVSAPTYPAADIAAGSFGGGVLLPASQISAGTLGAGVALPATQLTAGTVPAGVLTPASQISAGTIGAGVAFPYAQLTGAPAPGPSQTRVDVTGVTTPAAMTTIIDSGLQTVALEFMWFFRNNGPNGCQIQIDVTDLAGNTNTFGPATINANLYDNGASTWWLAWGPLQRRIARWIYKVSQGGFGASTYDFSGKSMV